MPVSVTFNAGETSQPITFGATQDTVDDDGESVLLAFGALPTGVTAGATDETTVSITDNDDPDVTVQFGASTYTAAEGSTMTPYRRGSHEKNRAATNNPTTIHTAITNKWTHWKPAPVSKGLKDVWRANEKCLTAKMSAKVVSQPGASSNGMKTSEQLRL